MDLSDFDFDLPEDLIALRPVRPRRASRLLVSDGALRDRTFADLADELAPGDLLVFNDTKVIPARLFGERLREGSAVRVEALLIRRDGPDQWAALARPGKRLRPGDALSFGDLRAQVTEKRDGGEVCLRFDHTGADLDAAIARAGEMPLPPYIAGRRPADAQDRDDYQTIFAENAGAVAAPTASLHFDEALMGALASRGVEQTRVTLHVGAGTFAPVKAERIEDHRMHAEWGCIDASAIETITRTKAKGGRVIPVGTTAMRLLETAGRGGLRPFTGETDIFIRPGHRFAVADGLITNFHLPRSTLMMLVAALTGMERMRAIYAHAVAARYRFYSYGDGSLLWPD